MGIRVFEVLPISALKKTWDRAYMRGGAMPWHEPTLVNLPGRGPTRIDALVVTTAAYRIYELPNYTEFHRLAFIQGALVILHEDGRHEQILWVNATFRHPLQALNIEPNSNILTLARYLPDGAKGPYRA